MGHLIDRIGLTHKAGGFFRPRKLKAKQIFSASGKVFLAFANYKLLAVKEASLVKNGTFERVKWQAARLSQYLLAGTKIGPFPPEKYWLS